jgi:hypothetical protein
MKKKTQTTNKNGTEQSKMTDPGIGETYCRQGK